MFNHIDRDNWWGWKCNALRCMIDSGENKYHDLIKKHTAHEDERVREIALGAAGYWE